MSLRVIAGSIVLFGLVGALETTPVATGRNPASILNLRLTVSKELPELSRKALINEATAIWREGGHVQLRWLAAEALPGGGMTLRVLVTPRTVSSAIEGHRWAVGELLRFNGNGAIAVASITGAQRIVGESQPHRTVDLEALYQHRLGVVLGRAVAHEIGHYVLRTNTHAAYGLMRAAIDAREFADLRAGSFRLDREAQAHLAARAAGDAEAAAEFEYPPVVATH